MLYEVFNISTMSNLITALFLPAKQEGTHPVKELVECGLIKAQATERPTSRV